MAKRKSTEPLTEVETEPLPEAQSPETSPRPPDVTVHISEGPMAGTTMIIEAKEYKGAKTILSLKGRDEWSEWLTELAKWCRTDRVGVLDRAASELAEKVGFRRPPPRL